MPDEILQVRMFGDLSVSRGGAAVNSGSDRSRKLWLLIAYLIWNRGTCVPPEELIGILWGDEPKGSNPANALKTLFHRARALLDGLGEGMGHNLLLRHEKGYAWNAEVPIEIDTVRFTHLCRLAETDGDARLPHLLEAAGLYRGSFLEKLSSEPWVQPIADQYRRLYASCVQEALGLLEERSRWEEGAALCRAALDRDPCSELFCRGLMNSLIRMEDQQEAVEIYAAMRERLMSEQGVLPSGELRALYETALRAVSPQTLSVGQLMTQLRETPARGAMICGFDFFRTVCHAYTRAVERSGEEAHLVLLSVTGDDGVLSARSLERVMDHMQEVLRLSLRRGDAAARCSASQFVMLLPGANYENSQMVGQRISRAFVRQYPHSPARLRMEIQPLVYAK